MEPQDLFNMLAGLLGAIGGWFLNIMWQAVRSLESKVAAIDVLVAGTYMKKEEAARMMDAIFAKLERIQDAIEKKADKP
jgi:hypothetical protein